MFANRQKMVNQRFPFTLVIGPLIIFNYDVSLSSGYCCCTKIAFLQRQISFGSIYHITKLLSFLTFFLMLFRFVYFFLHFLCINVSTYCLYSDLQVNGSKLQFTVYIVINDTERKIVVDKLAAMLLTCGLLYLNLL